MRFFTMLGVASTWQAIGLTLLRLVISFLICLVISIVLGLFGGLFKYFRNFLNPFVIVLRTLPTAAIIFILIVIIRPIFALQIILFLMMFPIIYQAVVNGMTDIDKDVIRSVKLETSVLSFKSIFKVILPSASSSIILGAIQALGLGMKAEIMAEVLLGSSDIVGLGRIIYRAYSIDLDMKTVFAASIMAIIIIGLIDLLLHYVKKNFLSKSGK